MNPHQDPGRDLLPWQWLLATLCLGILAWRYPLPAAGAAAVLFMVNRCGSRARLAAKPLLGAFLAGWLLAWMLPAPPAQRLPSWMEARKPVRVAAEIEQVRGKPGRRMQLILKKVRYETPDGRNGRLPAKLAWTWERPAARPAPGQTMEASLRVKPVRGFRNAGTWDSRLYWALRGVAYRAYSRGPEDSIVFSGEPGRLWSLRQDLRSSLLRKTEPGPGQGLLLALLMGDRSRLSYPTLDLVRRASLAHSLALSGLHLGFVVSLAWLLAWLAGWFRPQLFLRLPRQKAALLLAVPLVAAYLWLGQARPSLVRASLMFFFWGLLLLRGRRTVLLDGLLFALAVIVPLWPQALFDLGLQLSVVAVAGIILIWPQAWGWYQGLAVGAGLKRALAPPFALLCVSLVANATLLPLTASRFGQVSPHVLCNLLWLPVLGWVVLPLGLFGLALSQLPGGGIPAGALFSLAGGVLDWLLALLQGMDRLGWLEVVVPLRPGWPELLGYWLLLGLVVFCWKRPRRAPAWALALAASLLVLPSAAGTMAQSGRVSLRILDVGQGQAVLITTPSRRRVLIDGGGSWNPEFDLGRYAVSPALTTGEPPRLERVILSHADFDHLRGLFYELETYAVGSFAYNGAWPQGSDGARLRRAIRERDIPTEVLSAGRRIPLGSGLALEVLHPPQGAAFKENNNRSLVLRLVRGGQGLALIPGDLEQDGIERLLQSGADLEARVLVLPHHGSRTSLSPELYRRVGPEVAVISCGFLNVFRFPHPEVMDALGRAGIPSLSTARHGAIRIDWDGSGGMRIRTGAFRTEWRPETGPGRDLRRASM